MRPCLITTDGVLCSKQFPEATTHNNLATSRGESGPLVRTIAAGELVGSEYVGLDVNHKCEYDKCHKSSPSHSRGVSVILT